MNRKILTLTLITGLSLTAILSTSTPAEASYRSFLRDHVNNQQQVQQQPTVNQPQQQPASTIQAPSPSSNSLDNFWLNRRNRRISQPVQQTQPTQTTQPAPSVAPSNPSTTANHTVTQRERDMLRWINEERAKVGARPLQLDLELSRWARIKSQDMKDNNYFAHTSPTYGSPFEMMRNAGIRYVRAAENLSASQSPHMSHLRLMASDGHRRNILNPNFTHVGIGIVDQNSSGVLVTQLFNQK